MAIYKRGNIWWCHFFITGREFRQSLETGDRRKALEEEKTRIAKASEGKLVPLGTPFVRLAFSEAIDKFLAERKPRLAPKTVQTELERAKVVKMKLGTLALKKITAETVLAYMGARNGAGVSNATVNRELDIIRGVLKRARLWAIMADEVHAFPVRENIGRVLSYEEKLRLIKDAKEHPEWQSVRLAMTLALNTTMRAAEVRNLQVRDIDFLEKALVVWRSKTEAGERKIPLNTAGFAAVIELRDRLKLLFGEVQANWYLFPRSADRASPDPLRPATSWRRAWRNLTRAVRCGECGTLQKPAKSCWKCEGDISKLKSPTAGFRFHDLRHQAITELSEGGASDATITGDRGTRLAENARALFPRTDRRQKSGLGGARRGSQYSYSTIGEFRLISRYRSH